MSTENESPAAIVPAPSPQLIAGDLAAAAARATEYVKASKSEATRRAYRSDLEGFRAWCEGKRLNALPAFPETIALYIADLAATHKPSSIGRKLAAISVAHKAAGHPSPISLEPVRSTWQGIRRTLGVAVTKKAPVRASHLKGAIAELPDTLAGKRDKALLLVGYAGGFRRSELVGLVMGDVRFVPEGVVLHVRRSKTDQEGEGLLKAIHYGKHPSTCPVTALRGYLSIAGVTDGPIFRKVDRWGKLGAAALSSRAVALILKGKSHLLGLGEGSLGGHSLRAGMVTDALANGAAAADVMRQSGHRSRAVMDGYYREANLFTSNVTEKLGI